MCPIYLRRARPAAGRVKVEEATAGREMSSSPRHREDTTMCIVQDVFTHYSSSEDGSRHVIAADVMLTRRLTPEEMDRVEKALASVVRICLDVISQ